MDFWGMLVISLIYVRLTLRDIYLGLKSPSRARSCKWGRGARGSWSPGGQAARRRCRPLPTFRFIARSHFIINDLPDGSSPVGARVARPQSILRAQWLVVAQSHKSLPVFPSRNEYLSVSVAYPKYSLHSPIMVHRSVIWRLRGAVPAWSLAAQVSWGWSLIVTTLGHLSPVMSGADNTPQLLLLFLFEQKGF